MWHNLTFPDFKQLLYIDLNVKEGAVDHFA